MYEGSGRFRLRPGATPAQPTVFSDEQLSIIHNADRRVRVLAGPGTGKTATLVAAVANRVLERGVDPSQILVLTFSRRASTELTSRLVRALGVTTREPMVRTLHSYAYSLLRAQSVRMGEPPPRLLGAAESDVMIRELLLGHHYDGGGRWPEFLHQALPLPSFAAEVRDLLARCVERGISPGRIRQLGRRFKRPEWVALADFAREYPDVVDLRTGAGRLGPALDQAELMGAALAQLRDDETLAREQRRTRRIFVDEYQDVDPAQAKLIDLLANGADELVVVGDPDQAIYSFRGADPMAMRDIAVDRTIALTVGRRMAPAITEASRRIAALLPGVNQHRDLQQAPDQPKAGSGPGAGPTVEVRVFPSAAAQACYVADQLRRAHLQGSIAWKDMAVLVRSPAASMPVISRAFATAGIPLRGRAEVADESDQTVDALLQVLKVVTDPSQLTGSVALQLMSSPLARMDAIGLRQLRRELKLARPDEGASGDLLAAVLLGSPLPEGLTARSREPLQKVSKMLAAALATGPDAQAELVLWDLWQHSGLESELLQQALRGRRSGQRADAVLDRIVQLFARAAEFAELLPGAGIADFVEYFDNYLPLGTGHPSEGAQADAVQVLSAHASKGLEWEFVAVMDAAEGRWPNLRERGNLLGVDELLDLAMGVDRTAAGTASTLADERRLFYVAVTRARMRLLVTAVQNTDEQPSRFLAELAGSEELSVGTPRRPDGAAYRGLNPAELIADLRRAVTDPNGDPAVIAEAAAHLKTLAEAGFRAADPRFWWGLLPSSTTGSPQTDAKQISVSPSMVESILRCGLRAMLERTGGRSQGGQAQMEGIIVHALAHGLAVGVSATELGTELDRHLDTQTHLPPWVRERSRRLAHRMLGAAQLWMADRGVDFDVLRSEVPVRVEIPPVDGAANDQPTVTLTGRVDLVGRDQQGRAVIVDFKTGAAKVTKAEAQDHAQLATYQVAAALGGFADSRSETGGAELVYLRNGRPAVLPQERLSAEGISTWIGNIHRAADRLSSAELLAEENKFCSSCPVRTSCPLRDEGRQVTT